MLSSDTLLLVQVCITILTTALLVASAWGSDSPQEQRWWAQGNVLMCVGLALTSVAAVPPLLAALAGYGVLGLGQALVLRGVRAYFDATLSWLAVAAIAALSALGSAYFTLHLANPVAVLSFGGFYFAALNWLCAGTLLQRGAWRDVGIAAAGFSLLGMALFVRGVHTLLHQGPFDLAVSPVIGLTMLIVALAQVGICFGLMMMITGRYAERLRRLSTLDPLTGACNRAGLDIQGKRVLLRAQRDGRSLALVMMDIDHFKAINDNHGHPVGDDVLRHLARLLAIELRPHDLLTRFGGEEFLLVLDDITLADAIKLAERLRTRIASASVHSGQVTVRYTASLGVVCSDQHGYDLVRLIRACDAALYEAKHAGRNRVVAAAPP
ncbi:MAG: GGDEF domain-containing protein [Duganella sp.]